ncbi:hypothetical protein RO3G_06460 [Rhizopus delemar RA 99-880]|uniref:Uncharacterized protein n=3 Tax=Rhizopus TaxID=4842 RepID=I1BZX5_RHIO9|nr:hypothetical protein RO3G_06460 [Rhizopus delemar RA 99-880]|eukprot:EIE81755.1 hypothetical protein RO3G_06460 [Rhizopus delemar RA 99-880]
MKEGLAKAEHRVRMCQLAVETTSDWLMVDSWEARQTTYQRTAIVLDHFEHELNTVGDGVLTASGGDLIASFGHPGVWSTEDGAMAV